MNFMNFANVLAKDIVCKVNGQMISFPSQLTSIIQLAVTVIQIIVPVLLIIWGMLDLGKAVIAQKDDEIKKGQQTFVKRIVAAAIVFFTVTIVTLVIGLIGGDEHGALSCAKAILGV